MNFIYDEKTDEIHFGVGGKFFDLSWFESKLLADELGSFLRENKRYRKKVI